MTAAADLVLTNGEIHTLGDPDETHEALAVRDGRVVRLGSAFEAGFLAGVETREIDLAGRVVLPGFVDAHTHLVRQGRREVHADLSDVESAAQLRDRLRAEADSRSGWVLGFGADGPWVDDLSRDDLDAVSDSRPVAAFREDAHGVVVNSIALDAVDLAAVDDRDVERSDGDPTGLLVESGVAAVERALDAGSVRAAIEHAQATAHARGITAVHDMVGPDEARAYRDLDADDDLRLRVSLTYWRAHLDALVEAGLRPGHGSDFVRVGAVKAFADGSLASHTARLSEPYADGEGRGRWVTDPDDLSAFAERVADAGFQPAIHAIGDAAIGAVLDAYEAAGLSGARPRVEHAELATDDHAARMADLGAVASVQPNFHRWAGSGGLYETRLGTDRAARTNRLGALRDAGVSLAFGSDCMPLDPLLGVHHAVHAPTEAQSLPVTDALRASTRGGAFAAFEEGRLGTLATGTPADLVVIDASPWDADDVRGVDVALTVVDGDVVHSALPGVATDG